MTKSCLGHRLKKLVDMVEFLIPNYVAEGKNQLVIAIGCTGGKHRSVTLANELYERLSVAEKEYGVRKEHRDIRERCNYESKIGDSMSFSGNIKEEISRQLSPARHCQIAELAAIISMCGAVMIDSRGQAALKIHTENLAVARKYFTLLEKAFNIKAEISIRRNQDKKSILYLIIVCGRKDTDRILQAAKLLREDENQAGFSGVSSLVYQNGCCKRAFLRGAF